MPKINPFPMHNIRSTQAGSVPDVWSQNSRELWEVFARAITAWKIGRKSQAYKRATIAYNNFLGSFAPLRIDNGAAQGEK